MKKSRSVRKNRTKKMSDLDPVERDLSFVFDAPEKWMRVSEVLRHLPKNKTITLRLSSDLLDQYKELAKKKDIKYQKLIREALIEYLARKTS